jgi:membrane protein
VSWLVYVARQIRIFLRLSGLSAWRGFQNFYESNDLTYAASIAYYGLLSLFPFAMLALAVLGAITADDADRSRVLNFVLRFFPTQFEFITRQLDELRASPLSFGVAGTLGLVWGALGIFGAISSAVNYAWGVEKNRSFWHHKLFTFLMMLIAGAVLALALVLISASSVVGARWFSHVPETFPGLLFLQGLTLRFATTLLFIIVVGLIYYFVPNTTVRFRDVWIGAIVTGVLWKLTLYLFGWFVGDMSRYTRVNGSIAVVVVFLVWVYMQAVIFLYGVEFTAAYAALIGDRPKGKKRRVRFFRRLRTRFFRGGLEEPAQGEEIPPGASQQGT